MVGFRNMNTARHVQYNLSPEPKMLLERSEALNIEHIEDAMDDGRRMFMAGPQGEVTIYDDEESLTHKIVIDIGARLVLPKHDLDLDGGPYHPLNDGGYYLKTMDYGDLLKIPFTRGVGVVLPREMMYEDRRCMILVCDVIKPHIAVNPTRMSLDA